MALLVLSICRSTFGCYLVERCGARLANVAGLLDLVELLAHVMWLDMCHLCLVNKNKCSLFPLPLSHLKLFVGLMGLTCRAQRETAEIIKAGPVDL
ncbi:hypothetical protein ES288_A09G212900v1 [Gossypium darwinii]|uniref:Uncharacterized protein n=1 Tax=Gossypium darwinii TaxID=34276 RepID=A0A5D2FDN4_GOSDA|nr:hypothetical protein ES288_A09G212900v1 [Gossypium darwinii]